MNPGAGNNPVGEAGASGPGNARVLEASRKTGVDADIEAE